MVPDDLAVAESIVVNVESDGHALVDRVQKAWLEPRYLGGTQSLERHRLHPLPHQREADYLHAYGGVVVDALRRRIAVVLRVGATRRELSPRESHAETALRAAAVVRVDGRNADPFAEPLADPQPDLCQQALGFIEDAAKVS